MKKILVPVSFSSDSMNAARYAADLALACGAELRLYHVLEMPISVAEFPITDSVYEEMEETGLKWLDELKQELIGRTDGKVGISTEMQVGSVALRVQEQCGNEKPWLVVMGVAEAPIAQYMNANTSLYAMRHLQWPVLIVPEKAVYHPVRKIILACDPEDLAGGFPGPFMDTLKNTFGCEYELLNISTDRQKRETAKIFEGGSWNIRMKEIYPNLHIVPVDKPKVEEGISDYLEKSGADWVMVFPKHHSFLEFHRSHSKKLSRRSSVPVLAWHENK